ncbi:MAG: UvrD-helicase domain-containing protein [Chlamydiales bacterium]|nr:UvrD-helicase domain-containing protein [Chlamydiales bacterium]
MVNLNPEQTKAVEHIEGPLLVLAGAGSGKTRVVTARIIHLIDLGVPSSDIVALTFTNKAAEEMKLRILKSHQHRVWVSTFHSLCANILKESIHHLGYKNTFSIYDEQDSESVIKHILQSFDVKIEKSLIKTIKQFISNAKNHFLGPEDIKEMDSVGDIAIKRIYTQYQQALKEYNALDFDDLLFLTVQLFREHPDVLAYYQKKWPFLLIDEYQDTNHAQYLIAKMIVEKSHNIFAVGDPDQSIYSWRGADINNILRFKEDFPGATVIQLEQNYRSTSNILNAANSLIKKNTKRYDKNLWSTLGEGDRIVFKQLDNDIEEARFVVNKIKDYHKNYHASFNEIAIFYRTNAQSRIFEDYLLKENIPYKIVGGVSFYDRREIKDLIAILKLLVSPDDFVSFMRVINIPKRGIGTVAIKKIQEIVSVYNIPVIDFCRRVASNEMNKSGLSATQKTGIIDFMQAFSQVQSSSKKNSAIDEIIKNIINQFQILNYLKEDPETFEDRKANMDEFITKATEYKLLSPEKSLKDFLEDISLNKAAIENTNANDQIQLMTLHNSKGLEFDLVFMCGMEEDLFPHVNARDSFDDIEEERRLCYVGMTRAKKHLFLTASKYRVQWGVPKYTRMSRFISEIDHNFISAQQHIAIASDDEEGFAVGSNVFHATFGKGTIKKKYNTSLGITYDVYFLESCSSKTLVAKYAKLTLINRLITN